jgi:hypothetical protein
MDLVTLSPKKNNWTKFGNILIGERAFCQKGEIIVTFWQLFAQD